MTRPRAIAPKRVGLLVLMLVCLTFALSLLVLRPIDRNAGKAGTPGAGLTEKNSSSDLAASASASTAVPVAVGEQSPGFQPRMLLDASGFAVIMRSLVPWKPDASLETIGESWKKPGRRLIPACDRVLGSARAAADRGATISALMTRAMLWNSEGQAEQAYGDLVEARSIAESDPALKREFLATLCYFQGVTALRRGENDNCILCRGESSCILPIAPAAVHTKPTGSRLAIRHFTEMLALYPDDLEVRWLLNLAHMTLGEYPAKVATPHLITLDRFVHSEFDIGRFRDVGHLVGVNRFNQAGSGMLEDFDNDGRLDLVVSSFDPTEPLAVYRNQGNGTFAERSQEAGVSDQLGGMFCVQTDYNNDGLMDVYVARGAWLPYPVRPSLLRNDGDGHFTDVTREARLLDPVNSNSAAWADFDNDGQLDLFVCCELQDNRLYRNRADGTFEEVSGRAGLRQMSRPVACCKGATWIDFDNDDYPDLFLNYRVGNAVLFHNNRDGTFTDVSQAMHIDGPHNGFSCWAWDYDNDGWLDLFATCYDRSLRDIVRGLIGQPHHRGSNCLFHNQGGQSFEDVTKAAGLDLVFATMGSNFADLDNDGYLDMYLGTGDPDIATLVPNRMFKNIGGRWFAEITGSSGTGHLQKGHGVSCGDWDRDGDLDLFVQTGGVINGDKYHNLLFQNPGQGNHWLSIKLVGKKTNRAAIGARIKVVTAGKEPLTIYRYVSSGSSFGANPLEQHIGLAQAEKVARLEVHWPTSATTQVFRDVAVDQAIEVVEFAGEYRTLRHPPIPLPREGQ